MKRKQEPNKKPVSVPKNDELEKVAGGLKGRLGYVCPVCGDVAPMKRCNCASRY